MEEKRSNLLTWQLMSTAYYRMVVHIHKQSHTDSSEHR